MNSGEHAEWPTSKEGWRMCILEVGNRKSVWLQGRRKRVSRRTTVLLKPSKKWAEKYWFDLPIRIWEEPQQEQVGWEKKREGVRVRSPFQKSGKSVVINGVGYRIKEGRNPTILREKRPPVSRSKTKEEEEKMDGKYPRREDGWKNIQEVKDPEVKLGIVLSPYF